MPIATISATELHGKIVAGHAIEMIDVRTPVEFREIHATGAKLVPLDQFDAQLVSSSAKGDIYLLCQSGGRAKHAAEQLVAAGFKNAVVVEGGTQAWDQAGLPVQRGNQTIPLERQVRILAGAMVLLGSTLCFFVHPYMIALNVFVGASLLFSGLTGACGMGMLLAKMPWNQVRDSTNSMRC
jgi:rhodanese-related sulfurtransferase